LTPDPHRFAFLGRPRHVWAVGAVHGEVDRLASLHDEIGPRVRPGDRLVYLGNLLGHGAGVRETVDELLDFRRRLLALPGMLAGDVVFLRGQQEEMWQKLLQLQFAPNPAEVLTWTLQQGVSATLAAYGGDPREGLVAARDGAIQLTRWTNALRQAQRAAAGHDRFYAALRRAALTAAAGTGPAEAGRSTGGEPAGGLLLVSAGIDPGRPLDVQTDSFWWDARGFERVTEPWEGFARLIRGFDPRGRGLSLDGVAVTLDAGCGRGGGLTGARFAADGRLLDVIEA
jgi:hypothetical protein